MNVGFKISQVTESNVADAINFVSAYVLLPESVKRNNLRNLLLNYPKYIYYTANELVADDIKTLELNFTVDFVNLSDSYYRNISEQRLEIPIAYDGDSFTYGKLNAGEYFITSDTDVMNMLDEYFVKKKLLLYVLVPEETYGFSTGFTTGFDS